jgi:hypothetical protein
VKTMPKEFDVQELSNRLGYLYDRWQDEREYEDFADYRTTAAQYVVAAGGEFVKLDKRPFMLHFKYHDANRVYLGELHCTATKMHFQAWDDGPSLGS